MPHEPNLQKRSQYEALLARLTPLFDAYKGSRSALIREVVAITGLGAAAVDDSIGWMLDEFTLTDPLDWSVIRANAPRHLAEAAVWGRSGEYKEG